MNGGRRSVLEMTVEIPPPTAGTSSVGHISLGRRLRSVAVVVMSGEAVGDLVVVAAVMVTAETGRSQDEQSVGHIEAEVAVEAGVRTGMGGGVPPLRVRTHEREQQPKPAPLPIK